MQGIFILSESSWTKLNNSSRVTKLRTVVQPASFHVFPSHFIPTPTWWSLASAIRCTIQTYEYCLERILRPFALLCPPYHLTLSYLHQDLQGVSHPRTCLDFRKDSKDNVRRSHRMSPQSVTMVEVLWLSPAYKKLWRKMLFPKRQIFRRVGSLPCTVSLLLSTSWYKVRQSSRHLPLNSTFSRSNHDGEWRLPSQWRWYEQVWNTNSCQVWRPRIATWGSSRPQANKLEGVCAPTRILLEWVG